MKLYLIALVGFVSISAQAVPLKFDCNFLSTNMDGIYLQGRSATGVMKDDSWTAFAFEVFNEPFSSSQYIVRLENKGCEKGGLNCSTVTLNMGPSREMQIANQTISSFPQRNVFKTAAASTISLDVFDASFHPMTSGVVTYTSEVKPGNPYADYVKAKLVCIFSRPDSK